MSATTKASNTKPVAMPQTVTCDGSPLQIVLQGTDPQGKRLVYKVKSLATKGQVVEDLALPNKNHEVIYLPQKNFTGTDAFTFTVRNDLEMSESATVTIEVKAPVVASVAPASVPPPAAQQNPAPTAKDVAVSTAGKPVDFKLLAERPLGDTKPLIYDVSLPSNGKLTGTSPNIIYTPNDGFVGTELLTYKASNGTWSNPATVTITVTAATATATSPQPPQAAPIAPTPTGAGMKKRIKEIWARDKTKTIVRWVLVALVLLIALPYLLGTCTIAVPPANYSTVIPPANKLRAPKVAGAENPPIVTQVIRPDPQLSATMEKLNATMEKLLNGQTEQGSAIAGLKKGQEEMHSMAANLDARLKSVEDGTGSVSTNPLLGPLTPLPPGNIKLKFPQPSNTRVVVAKPRRSTTTAREPSADHYRNHTYQGGGVVGVRRGGPVVGWGAQSRPISSRPMGPSTLPPQRQLTGLEMGSRVVNNRHAYRRYGDALQ